MTQANTQPQIALLKWMLEDVRKVTLAGVEHLTKEQLFKPPIEGEYPIGAYLMHFCEVDIGWLQVISGTEQTDEIKKRAHYGTWYDSGPDSNPPIEPIDVNEYFEVMKITRKNFLDYVSSLKDSELEEIITRKRGDVIKTYTKKWIIYHIIEHEAHTRGQIFMLIRKAGWKKK